MGAGKRLLRAGCIVIFFTCYYFFQAGYEIEQGSFLTSQCLRSSQSYFNQVSGSLGIDLSLLTFIVLIRTRIGDR